MPGGGDDVTARLPRLSGREVVKAFGRLGWEQARQAGSHIIMVRAGHPATLSVPDHKEVALGTLGSLIRSAASVVTGIGKGTRAGVKLGTT